MNSLEVFRVMHKFIYFCAILEKAYEIFNGIPP